MTATLTVDHSGRIVIPEAVRDLLGLVPGASLTAEIEGGRIKIVKEPPLIEKTTRSPSGRLIAAGFDVSMDTAQALREERDALAGRNAP